MENTMEVLKSAISLLTAIDDDIYNCVTPDEYLRFAEAFDILSSIQFRASDNYEKELDAVYAQKYFSAGDVE